MAKTGAMSKFENCLTWVESHTYEEVRAAMVETLPGVEFNPTEIQQDRRGTADRIHQLYCLKLIGKNKLTLEEANENRLANALAPIVLTSADDPAATGITAVEPDRAVRSTALLPIASIDTSECIRHHWTDASIAELAENIAERGLINPVTVRKDGDVYYLTAGLKRLLAHKLLGWQQIEADVRDMSKEQAVEVQGSENIFRDDFTSWELIEYIDRMLSAGKPQVVIARLVRMQESNLSKIVKVCRNLAPDVSKVLQDTQPDIAIDTLIALAETSQDDQRLIIQEIGTGVHITKNDIRSRTKPVEKKQKEEGVDDEPEEQPETAGGDTELAFQMVLREAVASIRNWKGQLSPTVKDLLLELNGEVVNLINQDI